MGREYDGSIEERIMMEIIVDCYDEAEQTMGWFYYLEDTLHSVAYQDDIATAWIPRTQSAELNCTGLKP